MKHARDDYNRIQDPAGLIPVDEPVFLIRAKDVTAPTAVRQWAALARNAGASSEIVQAALDQAYEMDKWQQRHGSQVPDMPS